MLTFLKKIMYFPLASYFKFFAKIKLSLWKPKVIVVTGSIGKTTQFELLKSQIPQNEVYFADHVNSMYGICANILGLNIKDATGSDWFRMFFQAPFAIFSPHPKQKIAVFEADCDRPGEGKFLATLLNPDVTIWLSSTKTHSANFENLKQFKNVDEAIAYEFGYFAEYTKTLVIANSDFINIPKQLSRTKAKAIEIKENILKEYSVDTKGTSFKIDGSEFTFKSILPKESFFSIAATKALTEYLGLSFDPTFKNFEIPVGRGSIFKGLNDSTIIDSTYNSSKEAVMYFLDILNEIAKPKKAPRVFVMGDMRELGQEAKQEHREVASKINETVDQLICVGPLTQEYVIPNVSVASVKWFENAREVGHYLKENLPKAAIVLIKGSQNKIFLEEAVKSILIDSQDTKNLARQNDFWKKVKGA